MVVIFAVGSKIRSVDLPIIIFGWNIAGFVLILAKSLRVVDLPWHHFLGGQVKYLSIRDVWKVTGTDVQK